MAIKRTIKSKNYTTINNGFLRDSSISLKAKGLLAYLLSRPNDWEFYTNEIRLNCKDKKDSIAAGLKELEDKGYIKRSKKRNEKGQYLGGYTYHVYEAPKALVDLEDNVVEDNSKDKLPGKEKGTLGFTNLNTLNSELPNSEKPMEEKPRREKPTTEKPITENPPLLSKEYKQSTEYKLNTKTKANTESKLSTEPPPPKYKKHKENSGGVGADNEEIYKLYIDAGFGAINNLVKEIIDTHIKEHSKEKFKEALIEAVKNNKYKLSYVEGILKRYKKENKYTVTSEKSKLNHKEELSDNGLWQGM